MEIRSQVKLWFEENNDKMIEDILESIKIYSESYDRENVAKSLNQVLKVAEKLGFKTELRANGEVGVVFFGEGEETLGILSHVDVVPIGDIKHWNYSPYGEIANGNIYGRGVVDNKGMIISCLYGMAAIKALNLPIYKKLELIIGTREEIVWSDIETYYKEGHALPDYGFTPDGEFPIMNREKGNCELELIFNNYKCEGAYEVLDFKSGEAVNSVPGIASVNLRGDLTALNEKVFRFNKSKGKEALVVINTDHDEVLITAYGKDAHSSAPEQGDNALVTLSLFLSDLSLKNKGFMNLIQYVKENFHKNYFGEKLGLPIHPEYLNGEEMGKTVLVPSMGFTKDGFHLFMSIRPVYGTSKDEITHTFDLLSSKYEFEYKVTDYLDPLYVPRNHKFIEILGKSYEEVTNQKSEFVLAGGTSYAKALKNSVAFGPIFPGDEDTCHEVNEFISIKNLMKVTEIYALVIGEVLLHNESLK